MISTLSSTLVDVVTGAFITSLEASVACALVSTFGVGTRSVYIAYGELSFPGTLIYVHAVKLLYRRIYGRLWFRINTDTATIG